MGLYEHKLKLGRARGTACEISERSSIARGRDHLSGCTARSIEDRQAADTGIGFSSWQAHRGPHAWLERRRLANSLRSRRPRALGFVGWPSHPQRPPFRVFGPSCEEDDEPAGAVRQHRMCDSHHHAEGKGASALGDTSLRNTMSAGDGNEPIAAVAQRLHQNNLIRQGSARTSGWQGWQATATARAMSERVQVYRVARLVESNNTRTV